MNDTTDQPRALKIDLRELARAINQVDSTGTLTPGEIAAGLAPFIDDYVATQVAAAKTQGKPDVVDTSDVGAIRVTGNGLILAGNSLLGDLVEPSWRRRLLACVNHFVGVKTDRIEAATTRQAAPEMKPVRDAMYRAIASSRGHRDAMFRSDGDILETFLQHGLSDSDAWALVPREPTQDMRTAHEMYGDTSDWWSAVLAAAPAPAKSP